MSFELREHTADVAVEATGADRSELFAAVGDGLAAAGCDDIPASGGERFSFTVGAEGLEALLFDYLDQLIFERDVRSVLPVETAVTVYAPDEEAEGESEAEESESRTGETTPDEESWTLEGTARGVPLERVDAREIKAVTYSEMRLEERDDGWYAYVVFDV
jgi:SHS2 domain-containing protein